MAVIVTADGGVVFCGVSVRLALGFPIVLQLVLLLVVVFSFSFVIAVAIVVTVVVTAAPMLTPFLLLLGNEAAEVGGANTRGVFMVVVVLVSLL